MAIEVMYYRAILRSMVQAVKEEQDKPERKRTTDALIVWYLSNTAEKALNGESTVAVDSLAVMEQLIPLQEYEWRYAHDKPLPLGARLRKAWNRLAFPFSLPTKRKRLRLR